MKKGLRKLILSGAAVAAVAATLGTSTYAWYTTNPTVSANNIIGASTDSGLSSIFISNDYANVGEDDMAWGATVNFNGESDTANLLTMNAARLVPASYAGNGEFKKIDNATGDLGAASTGIGSNDYVQFTLYFRQGKAAADCDLYIQELKIENTTEGDLPVADNLLYTKGTTTTKTGGIALNQSKYQVDLTKALSFAYYNPDTTNGASGSFTLSTSTTRPATERTGTYLIADGDADAQGYYDAVMTKNDFPALQAGAKSPAAGYNKAAIAKLNKDGETYSTVHFFVYLDGASKFCYDGCIQQNFKLNIKFTNQASKAMAVTVA